MSCRPLVVLRFVESNNQLTTGAQMQPGEGPEAYHWVTYAWVIFMGVWGGVASWIRKVREGHARPVHIMELLGEVVVSTNLSIGTVWLCEWQKLDPVLSAAIVGVSAHFGTRGFFLLESALERVIATRLGFKLPPGDDSAP